MNDTPVFTASSRVRLDQAGALETALEMITDAEGIAPPLLTYYEIEEGQAWQLEIYFEGEMDYDLLDKIKKGGGCEDLSFTVAQVSQKDWVSESQKGLPPVIAGRFCVYGSHDADSIPTDKIPLLVDASQAFGTGHHETTSGCLELIDELDGVLSQSGDNGIRLRVLDVGTGTGVLALAAQRIWPKAITVASDIDPIAVEVTERTLRENNEPIAGSCNPGITPVVATGLDDSVIARSAPYDLILANILAAPLIDLAADIAGATAPGGYVILSGLLIEQKKNVLAAYSAQGLKEVCRKEKGEWAALLLKK